MEIREFQWNWPALAGGLILALGIVLATAVSMTPTAQGQVQRQIPVGNCKRVHAEPGAIRITRFERTVRCLINNLRRRADRAPLRMRRPLRRLSRRHSRVMRTRGCFDHFCGLPHPQTRVLRSPYVSGRWRLIGFQHVIGGGARDRGSPYGVVHFWHGVPEIRPELVRGPYRDLGVGAAFAGRRSFVTLNLARRSR